MSMYCVLIDSERESTGGEGLEGKLRQPLERELRKGGQGKRQERRTRPLPFFVQFPLLSPFLILQPLWQIPPLCKVSQPRIWMYCGCLYINSYYYVLFVLPIILLNLLAFFCIDYYLLFLPSFCQLRVPTLFLKFSKNYDAPP